MIVNHITLVGVFAGDIVNLNASAAVGTFNNANVGAGKPVTVSGLALAGADAGNYSLTQPVVAASITAQPLTLASGPTATPNPGTVGQAIKLSCDTTPTGSTYSWDFGDGTTDSSGSGSVTHKYAAASTAAGYLVTVTATNGAQTITGTVNVVVNAAGGGGGGGGTPTPTLPMSILKKSLRGKIPSAFKDSLSLSGALALPDGTTVLPSSVVVTTGSFGAQFSLIKGKGKTSSSSLSFKGKSKKGVLLSTAVTFKAKFVGDFSKVLEAAGLPASTSGSVTLPLRFDIGGKIYATDVNLSITATAKSIKGL